MPGQLLHRVAQRVCADQADRVFEPLIADLQREWIDAKPGVRRAFALARAYAAFWFAIAFAAALVGVSVLRTVGAPNYYWHMSIGAIVLNEAHAWSFAVIFAAVPLFMYARPEPGYRWNATASHLLAALFLLAILCVGWARPALMQAAEHTHPHGQFLADSEQPGFQSLPTVIRMIRTSDDPMWWHTLDRRLAELVNVVVLGLIGWSLSGIQRPSAGRVAFWWFALMEFVSSAAGTRSITLSGSSGARAVFSF